MSQGLKVTKLVKSYGGLPILQDVSFDVQPGEIVTLLGPSGCGKSTTLALIAGLEQADSGEITWDGTSLAGVPPHRRGMGMMFQDLALFPHLNVFENIAFGLRLAGMDADAIHRRVSEMLELVGLSGFEKRDVQTLSGGEQQRVALARGLAPQPRLLMLDEPLGSLDRGLRERLVLELRRILKEMGQMSIYVTHDQEEAFIIGDRIVLMNTGRVEQIGAPQAVYLRPANPFVARFLGMDNLFEAESIRKDGKTWLKLPFLDFEVPGDSTGSFTVLVRPDGATLNTGEGYELRGTIKSKTFRGETCHLELDTGRATLKLHFSSHLELPAQGQKFVVWLKPSAFQVFDQQP